LQDHRLAIVADNAAPNHPYIQKVWLNDKLLDRYWIQHAEIARGGTLRFEMGAERAKAQNAVPAKPYRTLRTVER
jgi:putative alpha-1,2-mannosidase